MCLISFYLNHSCNPVDHSCRRDGRKYTVIGDYVIDSSPSGRYIILHFISLSVIYHYNQEKIELIYQRIWELFQEQYTIVITINMYSTSIRSSTLFALALLAGSSLSLPNLLGRDDASTIKCSEDFPIQHVCKVTGEAKPIDIGNENSDYNIIFNVYAPARKDQEKNKPWPYLANTWQQVVKNADWKKKDYELDIPAIKDGRLAGEVDG